MKYLLSLFVIAHGLMHASYLTPKPNDLKYPFRFDKGWFFDLIGSSAKPFGAVLSIIIVLAFLAAGLSLIGLPGLESLWKILLTIGACSSCMLLLLFWHPWLVLGLIINAVLLLGMFVFHWTFWIKY